MYIKKTKPAAETNFHSVKNLYICTNTVMAGQGEKNKKNQILIKKNTELIISSRIIQMEHDVQCVYTNRFVPKRTNYEKKI